jgi:hypothetical protein
VDGLNVEVTAKRSSGLPLFGFNNKFNDYRICPQLTKHAGTIHLLLTVQRIVS